MSRSIEGMYEDISNVLAELSNDIKTKFDLVAVPILCKYYTSGASTQEFISALQASGIEYDICTDGLRRGNARASAFSIRGPAEPKNYLCTCGGRLELKYDYTYIVCADCGAMQSVVDTTTREDNSGQDTTPKRATHSPTKHYEQWAQKIQGTEAKEFNKDHLAKIVAVMKRDKIAPRSLTCEIMRDILKDKSVRLTTDLNEHVTKLVCTLGGPPPPRLTEVESNKAREMFIKIMYYYEKQHPTGGNRPYYPYFIYRIYEHLFHGTKKAAILNYIHLQGEDTVREHDNDLRRICEEAKDNLPLKYTATIRPR